MDEGSMDLSLGELLGCGQGYRNGTRSAASRRASARVGCSEGYPVFGYHLALQAP